MNRTLDRARPNAIWPTLLLGIAAIACLSILLCAVAPQQAYAKTKTVKDVFGVSRVELVKWLSSHEKDKYYLTTPYKPYDWRSPKGDINKYGKNSDGKTAGMNCTGFVWHALCAAHKWKDKIATKLPGLTGWATLIKKKNLKSYTFTTKKKMLNSGKLEKGDIIWMWEDGDSSKKSSLHHVAIFWGDKSNQDKMWHSSGDPKNNWKGTNKISKIKGKAAKVYYQVIKTGGKLNGAISLVKVSSNESVTKGNAGYSLKGAVYGVFNTKAKAATHEAGKALRTYTTDDKGSFTTGEDFLENTYYVSEISASPGYELDNEVYTVKVTAGKTVKVNGGTVPEKPVLGAIKLTKKSANASLTDKNRCYSLKGASYGVFAKEADAATHNARKATKSYVTDENGSFETPGEWAAGRYYIAETAASEGYSLDNSVYAVDVVAGKTAVVNAKAGYTPETPKSNPITLWAVKADAQTPDHAAQGSATLLATRFEICYYDGYYDLKSLPKAPTRTWVVKSGADGKAYARDDSKVSGDAFFRTASGKITIPLGTVTVREAQPPAGYLPSASQNQSDGRQLVQIRAKDAREEIGVYVAPTFANHVMRGGVTIGKIDRQNGGSLAQGDATLEGARFEIVSENDQQVIVDGVRYEKGQTVATVQATRKDDGRIVATLPADRLPIGAYKAVEVKAGEGYVLDDTSRAWAKRFQIEENGQLVDLTDPSECAGNQVVRGDFSFTKVDAKTKAAMGMIAFSVTSQTTGERHIIVTDDTGAFSSASDFNAHSQKTNSNDAAVSENGDAEGGYSVDESKLDPRAGVWFDGRTDAQTKPDDSLGALPHDTYEIEELRTSANAGYDLSSFTVSITEHGAVIELGEVEDHPDALIHTSLADDNEVKLAPANSTVKLVDTVRYENLFDKKAYTLIGELHAVTPDGQDGGVVAESQVEFTPENIDGTVEVPFSIETEGLQGSRLVAFERLAGEDGTTLAAHEDIRDEGQTVRVPVIGTTLCDGLDGDHGATADDAITLVDTVSYRGLATDTAYTMTGELHLRNEDGSDGGVATDEEGKPITSKAQFTPTAPEGTTEVAFTFTAPSLAGKTVVAFEELTCNNKPYAVHADISDEGQTVRFAPPIVEKGQPPEEDEEEHVEQVQEQEKEGEQEAPAMKPQSDTPSKPKKPGMFGLPRTGDGIDVAPFAVMAVAAALLTATSACCRRAKRKREIVIERNPRNRFR